MSSDESTGTQISTVSSPDGTKTKLKPHKSEEWEINLIGNFVLGLYHRSYVSPNNEWLIRKSIMREEYSKFINADLRKKLNELNGTSDIGTMLHRCGFLLNTPRGNSSYKIKYSALFDFRNNKIKQLDNLKINTDGGIEQKANTAKSPESILLELVDNVSNIIQEDNFEVDENEKKIPLEYQGSLLQLCKENYVPTNMSCCICEEDFNTMETYEDHIQKHGDDTDFEFLTTMGKFDSPIFKMSYRLCKNSHYFCFEFETMLEDLIIDKIIIVQSRSFYYVHNMRVPYKCPENSKDRFFVDSHLFTIHVEQPIVLICHVESTKETRLVEQHHFMRSEEFPKVNFSFNPNRLPDKKTFKPKFQLADYYPPKEIQDALKDDFYYEKLMKTSNDFRDYVRNGKILQPQNIGASINILLQIEDMDTIQQYLQLTQKNIKLRSYGDEYSFQLKPKQRVFIENILSIFDEVILTTRTDILTKPEDLMQLMLQNKSDINRMKNTYVGLIQAVNTGRISFKCDKKINMNNTYTVICRPSRLNFRYQYRSLEILPIAMDFLKKFLFPAKIMPRPLPTNSLNLYNTNISGEQLQAVRNISEGPRNDATYIVFGPPGTGKTTTIVEAILQLLKKPNTKILVTASSNSACDEVALRLCKYLKQLDISRAIVRIFSRSSEIRTETIDDELLENSNMYNGQFYPDIEVLHEYRIVVCTLSVVAKLATGKFGRQENGGTLYTHLFIDEVAASMEAEALIAITTVLTPKSCLIISGDHKQLGPILKSNRAKELGLDVSLMDRLLKRDCYRVDDDTNDYDRTIQTRLIRNYRSHPAIVNLYSGLFYNHSLESFAKQDDVSLCEIWHKSRNKQYPITFHAIYEPSRSDYQSHSLYNLRELEVVMDYVKDLMYFGINGKPVKECDIGIISPYKKQYRRIQEELNIRKWFGIETGSVETFQGKEKDIIIVSFVRSGTRNLGFLDNPRRLNVTISRPKALLILVGNPVTLSLNSDFEYIIKECQRNKTFVGASGPPKSRGGEGNVKKQTAEAEATNDLLKLLNINMNALSVDKKDGEEQQQGKNTEKSNRRRVQKHGGKRRANSKNKNKNGNDKNEKNVDDEDDDDEDDDVSVASSKPSSSGMRKNVQNKRQFNNRAGPNSGKISKQYGKGKQKNVSDNSSSNSKKLDKNKIESLFDDLPKVPATAPNTTMVNPAKAVSYTSEQLMQMRQQQQQYFQNVQQQQQQQQQQLPQWHNNSYSNMNNSSFFKMPTVGQCPPPFMPTAGQFPPAYRTPFMGQQQQQHQQFNSAAFNQQSLQYSSPFNNGNGLRFPNMNVSNNTMTNIKKDNANNGATAAAAANKANTNNRKTAMKNYNKRNNGNRKKAAAESTKMANNNKTVNTNTTTNTTKKPTKIAANIHATAPGTTKNVTNNTNVIEKSYNNGISTGTIPKTKPTGTSTAATSVGITNRPGSSIQNSYITGAINPIAKTTLASNENSTKTTTKPTGTSTTATSVGITNRSGNSIHNSYTTGAINPIAKTTLASNLMSTKTTVSISSNSGANKPINSGTDNIYPTLSKPTSVYSSKSTENSFTSSYSYNTNDLKSYNTTNSNVSTKRYAPSAPDYDPVHQSMYVRPTRNLSYEDKTKNKKDNSCVIS